MLSLCVSFANCKGRSIAVLTLYVDIAQEMGLAAWDVAGFVIVFVYSYLIALFFSSYLHIPQAAVHTLCSQYTKRVQIDWLVSCG